MVFGIFKYAFLALIVFKLLKLVDFSWWVLILAVVGGVVFKVLFWLSLSLIDGSKNS